MKMQVGERAYLVHELMNFESFLGVELLGSGLVWRAELAEESGGRVHPFLVHLKLTLDVEPLAAVGANQMTLALGMNAPENTRKGIQWEFYAGGLLREALAFQFLD